MAKGSLLAGIVFLAQPWGLSVTDRHIDQVPINVQYSITDAWQGYQNDITGLIDRMNQGTISFQELQDWINRFNRDIVRVGQETVKELDVGTYQNIDNGETDGEDLLSRLRKLVPNENQPSGNQPTIQPSQTQSATSGISVNPGDPGVTTDDVNRIIAIMGTTSLFFIPNELGKKPSEARIVLFSSKDSFAAALRKVGFPPGLIPHITENTDGMTMGTVIWIPLYNSQDNADLANVITHELTHITLNEMGVSNKLPVWMNEGICWMTGMTAKRAFDPDKTNQQENKLNQQLRAAVRQGRFVPLAASENDILRASYNVEWEDYLAVQNLILAYGLDTFQAFLKDVGSEGVLQSFQKHYGMSLGEYESRVEMAMIKTFTYY